MAENKPLTTSWMWKQADGEVWGLTINRDKNTVEWYDGIGCACGDSFAEQAIHDFLEKGPRYGSLPDDVMSEVKESLAGLQP